MRLKHYSKTWIPANKHQVYMCIFCTCFLCEGYEGRRYFILAYTSQLNSVFRANWLVLLSRDILPHSPPNKTRWRPVLFKLRKKNFLLINEVTVPYNTKKATKFGKKVFKDLYIFYFLAINALRMSLKCFVYKWWVDDKPTLSLVKLF